MHEAAVKVGWVVILGILVKGFAVEGLWCDRAPHSVTVPKTSGDNGYKIVVSGEPDKYIPGIVYTVRLQAPGNHFQVDKFTGFLLVAEPTDGLAPESSAGDFQLAKSDSSARFSEYCPHAVKHASEVSKTEVQIQWIAPTVATGCVSFRATIIKNKGQWFMDDGNLTKQLCPEVEVGEEEAEDTEPCCACDEAKYELTFEGLWSPLTHPKDFPADAWSAHFSDIVGASHSPHFRFWQQHEPASEGLVQLAEAGDSKDLERELKDDSANIRTIIKARGLRHPNFYGHKTFAVFRADKEHNLISLVSKISPSPDWFVGVSGQNLCLPNCSWVDSKVILLHPWDSGSDSGISYLSESNPTIPRERISRIVRNFKEESPFYDPGGGLVKPFAKLRIQKQRSYGTCDENSVRIGTNFQDWEDEEDSFEDRPECAVSPWREWTPCSATCGKGVKQRRRQYLNSRGELLGCGRNLTQSMICDSYVPCNSQPSRRYDQTSNNFNSYTTPSTSYGGGGRGSQPPMGDPCATTDWRAWGGCSKACGQGIRKRLREFLNPPMANSFGCNRDSLVMTEMCYGSSRNCNNEQEQVVPGCETTEWGNWEPCTATVCGNGTRVRQRVYAYPNRAYSIGCNASMMESQPCEGRYPDCDHPEAIREICLMPQDSGACVGSYTRWYFDFESKTCKKFKYSGCPGNANIFDKEEECERTCGSLRGDDTFSEPMMRHQSYGGYGHKSVNVNHHLPTSHQQQDPYSAHYQLSPTLPPYPFNIGPVVDCTLSEWGPWSRCSVDCGRGHKYRSRYIVRFPQNDGKECEKLEHRRKCKGISCPINHPFYNNLNSNTNYQQQYPNSDGHGYYDGYIH